MRPALHGALLDAVGRQPVEVNSDVTGFETDGPRVRVLLANGASAVGDILVGADGVGSVIRARLHPDEPPPRRSGYFALRGLSHAIDRLEGLGVIWYFGRGVESAIARASADSIYWFLSLFTDDVKKGPVDVSSVMRRFAAGFDAQFHAIAGTTLPNDMRLDELLARDPLPRWGAGPITLLGDAAHPMLPHTGQGAAQALEDAVALGRALRPGTDAVTALRHYEAIRSPLTRRVVKMGPWIARVTTTKNPLVALLRNGAIRSIPEFVLVRSFGGPSGST
jgi:2-polyprenyl-6-methoxyphenol hydroxylase-like FAD-dependent oxidoreductase